jgi:hypothetical protein
MGDIYHVALIPLTQGKFAIVDFEDYHRVGQYKWSYRKPKHPRHSGYAGRTVRENGRQSTDLMHRVILRMEAGLGVDHKNGNGLDNRKDNIRPYHGSQNSYNSGKRSKCSASPYKGVFRRPFPEKPWTAYIRVDGHPIYLGIFASDVDAAIAYNHAAGKYHGEFAYLNQIPVDVPTLTVKESP